MRTLLDPSLVSILFAFFDAVNIVFERRHDFRSVPVTRKLAFTASAIDPAVELGVVDDGQENGVGHPLRFLRQQRPLVRRPTRVLVDSQGLLVQELETAHLAFLDEA